MAFSMALDAALEPLCSDLTVLHMALWGADPLVLVLLAEAAVSGARASVSPRTAAPIPTHLDRCLMAASSMCRIRGSTLQHSLS